MVIYVSLHDIAFVCMDKLGLCLAVFVLQMAGNVCTTFVFLCMVLRYGEMSARRNNVRGKNPGVHDTSHCVCCSVEPEWLVRRYWMEEIKMHVPQHFRLESPFSSLS